MLIAVKLLSAFFTFAAATLIGVAFAADIVAAGIGIITGVLNSLLGKSSTLLAAGCCCMNESESCDVLNSWGKSARICCARSGRNIITPMTIKTPNPNKLIVWWAVVNTPLTASRANVAQAVDFLAIMRAESKAPRLILSNIISPEVSRRRHCDSVNHSHYNCCDSAALSLPFISNIVKWRDGRNDAGLLADAELPCSVANNFRG